MAGRKPLNAAEAKRIAALEAEAMEAAHEESAELRARVLDYGDRLDKQDVAEIGLKDAASAVLFRASRFSTGEWCATPLADEMREANMPESDDILITPQELRLREPKFGLALQRKYRVAGEFIPHIRLGNRIFYRLSSVEKFLSEKETQGGGDADDD